MSGRKKVLTAEQVVWLNFPQTPECSLAKLWELIRYNSEVKKDMPDSWTKSEKADRRFLIGLLCTLYTDFMRDFGEDVRRIRAQRREMKQVKPDSIDIQPEWLAALSAAPY